MANVWLVLYVFGVQEFEGAHMVVIGVPFFFCEAAWRVGTLVCCRAWLERPHISTRGDYKRPSAWNSVFPPLLFYCSLCLFFFFFTRRAPFNHSLVCPCGLYVLFSFTFYWNWCPFFLPFCGSHENRCEDVNTGLSMGWIRLSFIIIGFPHTLHAFWLIFCDI